MTEFETTPEGWIKVTLTGDEEFPVLPWHVGKAAGPPYPDYWVDCPACEGDGCGSCDGIGRLHPNPADWIADELARYEDHHFELGEKLNDPAFRCRARRATEWMMASAEVAAKLVDRWYREDGGEGEDHSLVESSPWAEERVFGEAPQSESESQLF